MKLKHVCEVCGKEEILTSDEGFERGWDYPPRLGDFGVLSPRTCRHCPMMKTLWWQMQTNQDFELSKEQLETLGRIMNEPYSIEVDEAGSIKSKYKIINVTNNDGLIVPKRIGRTVCMTATIERGKSLKVHYFTDSDGTPMMAKYLATSPVVDWMIKGDTIEVKTINSTYVFKKCA